ncbi:MAG: hypothetical protein EBX51_03655 [Acidimicrobiia bacterium]|nr:hypothetical protein [Acidimicrobiia bacterium]
MLCSSQARCTWLAKRGRCCAPSSPSGSLRAWLRRLRAAPWCCSNPGTIFTENLIHGSDSAASAEREIQIFFPGL